MSSIIFPIIPALCVLHRTTFRSRVSEEKRSETTRDKQDVAKLWIALNVVIRNFVNI